MNTLLIFVWVYAAMIAMAFWEAYVEGRKPWDKGKLGWKVRVAKKYYLPAYQFYLFFIMLPVLFTLPLVALGWDTKLFGILLSAYFSGIVLEDFMWYVVNPVVKLSEFNSRFAKHYPWVKLGKFELPALYIIGIGISVLSWALIWR